MLLSADEGRWLREHRDVDIFSELEAEHEHLSSVLSGLTAEQWATESSCPGWTVADVVLHLAQTEEAIPASAGAAGEPMWRDDGTTVDAMVAAQVSAQRGDPFETFARWERARRAAVETLRAVDPQRRLTWAAAPLKPSTLATTRIAEHWAHALDITTPLGIPYSDTDRLRHIAWLGHSTLPYAFGLEGLEAQPVRAELVGPDGDRWTFGPEGAPNRITGLAGEWCRVGARRLTAAETSLVASGPRAADVLRVLRNYAF
jgi:uncharacterized protein (TIGR03084 family)